MYYFSSIGVITIFIIDKLNRINLTKGDTAIMNVGIYDLEDGEYIPKDTDTITFTVRNQTSAQPVITKIADNLGYIELTPEDTSALNTGLYLYDVQLSTNEGRIYTIIPATLFTLSREVTQ